MSAEVAERAGAGRLASKRQCRASDVAPVLEIAPAEVTDLAELAPLDHLAGEAHCRHEAVVEGAEMLDAGRGDTLPDVVALVRIPAERLLAGNVLARLGRPDRRLCMERVRAALSKSPIEGSLTMSRQSVVHRSYP